MESIDKNVKLHNILFYVPDYVFGGIRTVTEILAKEFKKRGHKVYWLHLNRVYGDNRDFHGEENCYLLPSESLFSDENVKFYQNLLKDKGIDVVINQHGLYEGAYFMENALPGVRVLNVIHSNPVQNYNWLFRDLITLKNNSAKEYIKRIFRVLLYPRIKKNTKLSITNHFKKIIRDNSSIVVLSPSYIDIVKSVVPDVRDVLAIPNPNTYSLDRDTNILNKGKIVLFVGRLDNRSKKIQYLLRIWSIFAKKISDWKLIIVGDGPDGETLKEQARSIPNIEFVGFQDPLPYYKKASILCLTSIFEGFPMCITEAMQNGCVPIAFNSFPAIVDMIQSGYNGEVVEPFKIKKYAEVLSRLMLDSDYRVKLANNAMESVKKYDIDNVIKYWETAFN